ncbi:MAG: hypothetical protein H7Y20_07920 [Bryobacteraceae bacterium]|nr:hypothetical protein [Bryobacteraceae bacterium]
MSEGENTKESLLSTGAAAIGKTAGKVVSLATGAEGKSEKKAKASGKLPKTNKSRLPRREKKELKKKAAKQALAL